MARNQNASAPVMPPSISLQSENVPEISLPYVSPLNAQRQQQQIQMQRQRYAITNQSPAVGLHTNPDDNDNHNSSISPTSNAQPSQVSTFSPDPILYDDNPPPSPVQSSRLIQQQHEYLDQLITDFIVLGMY